MAWKSSALLMRSLIVVAAVSTASVPAVPDRDAGPASISGQATSDQPGSAPLIVAQGRCYNGRCY
ncbi:MAG TPA: hypothetical protein VFQ87_15485 [Bradyrhizobium sp.]|jgi:hypothetical protein|nr:hypothetical protein [Bradyrhizobium sp.]